jgi:hypothetical protein
MKKRKERGSRRTSITVGVAWCEGPSRRAVLWLCSCDGAWVGSCKCRDGARGCAELLGLAGLYFLPTTPEYWM